jgi:DNA-directed RNA polymerase specialized sigma24 family protein
MFGRTPGETGKVLPIRGGTNGSGASDLQLLAGVSLGDNRALRELFDRYGDRVFRILKSDCGLETRSASRAVRDVFLLVSRSTRHFDKTDAVAGWIVRLTLNVGLLAPKRLEPASRSSSEPEANVESGATDRTPEMVTAFESKVAALPFRLRVALTLVERESMNEMEIAAALRIRTSTVWRRVSEANRALIPQGSARQLLTGLTRLRRSLSHAKLCPALWRINRAISVAFEPRVGWHISSCRDCARESAVLAGLSARLSGLPRHQLDDDVRNEIAVSLLAVSLKSDHR